MRTSTPTQTGDRRLLKRRNVLSLAGGACLWGAVGAPGPAMAASARIVSITIRKSLPVMRPDTPVPHDPGLLFYFQLSSTRNTVVYAARYDEEGQLDRKNPVSIYWRKYQTDGGTRALNVAERTFAYSLDYRARKEADSIDFSFRAVPGFTLSLRQTAPYRAGFFGSHGGREMELIYGYLTVIDGPIPKVPEIRMFGRVAGEGYGDVLLKPRG